MNDYFLYKDQPIIIELKQRLTPIISELVGSRFDRDSLYKAQMKLLEELLTFEENIQAVKKEYSETRRATDEIAVKQLSKKGYLSELEKEEIKIHHKEADSLDFSVKLLRYGHWFIRYVADGIAWHAYSFNRTQIRALGSKEAVSFLSGKEGLVSETEMLNKIRSLGTDWLPILHDLTNCLRIGDISIFWKSQLIDIIDVKANGVISVRSSEEKLGGRKKRQKQRLDRLWNFFETENLSDMYPDLWGKAVHTKAIEKHNFEAISSAMKKARRIGYGLVEPEPGLLYLAWHLDKSDENIAIQKAAQRFPHIYQSMITFRAIQPRFDDYHSSLPITAMELPANDILDLIFGKIAVLTILNFDLFEKQCRHYDLPLHVTRTDNEFKMVVSDPFPGEVQEGLWNRLMLEGLSIKSFCSLIKSIFKEVELQPTSKLSL